MFKAALIAAGSAAALGLATLALAQDPSDELYYSINDDPAPWFLQRSTCTLAHNATGNSIAVVRFRIGMGTEIEFLDPALLRVRPGETVSIVVTVDGASEEALGIGVAESDRRGYLLTISDVMLDRIAAGQRLAARSGGRELLRLDLAGAGPAIAALRSCQAEAEAFPAEMNVGNAM